MVFETLENRRLLSGYGYGDGGNSSQQDQGPQNNQQTVLTFDDITSDPAGDFVPQGYGGFTYSTLPDSTSQFAVESNSEYQSFYHNTYGAPSGQYAAYNQGYTNTFISRPTAFNFVGASFSSFAGFNSYQSTSAKTLTLTGFRNGTAVNQLTVQLSPTGYNFVRANFRNIDTLEFTAAGAPNDTSNPNNENYFLFDNFTFAGAKGRNRNPGGEHHHPGHRPHDNQGHMADRES
jgi:hypothetical protein